MAHGKIIYAESVQVPNRNYHVFKFMATFDLVPTASVIVYRVKDGELVSAYTEFKIEDDLNNFVKLKLSKTEVKPGEDVNIDIITKSASHVGLVGVDQSVLLLKKNSGLTKEDAIEEMNKYQSTFYDVPEIVARQYYRHNFYSFDRNDVILFTNAKKEGKGNHERIMNISVLNNPFQRLKTNNFIITVRYYSEDRVYFTTVSNHMALNEPFAVRGSMEGSVGIMQSSASAGFGGAPKMQAVEPPKIRKDFPETWLWEDFDINK